MDLTHARTLVAAVVDHAQESGLRLSVAVVDDRGHEVAVVRMDGATWFTPGVARSKARTAVAFGRPTAALAALREAHPEVLRLASEQLGFSTTTLPGGLPVESGGRIVGAVGVSGASPDEDVVAAGLAVAAYGGTGQPGGVPTGGTVS